MYNMITVFLIYPGFINSTSRNLLFMINSLKRNKN